MGHREQSLKTSIDTRSTSSIVTVSPLAASSSTVRFNTVTGLPSYSSSSAASTGTLARPPSYDTIYNLNNPVQVQDRHLARPSIQSTGQTLISPTSHSGHWPHRTVATPVVSNQPTDLIKQLLLRNLQTSKLLSQRVQLEQERSDNSPEQLEKLQTLHEQQLKTKQNFLQLTSKLREIRNTRQTVVSPPGVGDVTSRLPRQPERLSGSSNICESHPMTVISQQARQRPEETESKMETRLFARDDISPHINTCDFPVSTDFIEASIYASSPNSLFMYEQEKMDMQSTIPSMSSTYTIVDTSAFQDDFELKPKYETSQDLSNSVSLTSPSVSDQAVSSTLIYDTGGGIWDDTSTKQNDNVLIKKESSCDNTNPTLAELNLDLLDDIQNVIDVDMNLIPTQSVQLSMMHGLKQETSDQISDKNKTYETLTRVGMMPTRMSSEPFGGHAKVKEEPSDFPSYHTLQTVKPLTALLTKSEPTQTKTLQEVELSRTEKHGTSIDISDTSTLQQLLHGRPLDSLARVPRTRSVSENMDARPRTSVTSQSRKRGSTSAGLESMDRKWEEIKKFIHMETQDDLTTFPPTNVKRERKRYDSASSAMTLTSNEDEDSDTDRDLDDDSDSDFEGGTDLGMLNPEESLVGNSKEKQYFWQYNVQSKGPKGTRVHFDMEEDPHVLNDFEDPVFDPVNSSRVGVGITIKHGGKARKGDGNDIVPNPKRLCQIGLQLRKINKQINDFVPVSELPSAARNKTRKEKNKLASRACRLKKKAQHEANKIKLNGLETEHYHLLTVIKKIRKILVERLEKKEHLKISMAETLDQLIKEHLRVMIAGNTTDFVNRVVRTVENGDMTGGINMHTRRSYPKELHN